MARLAIAPDACGASLARDTLPDGQLDSAMSAAWTVALVCGTITSVVGGLIVYRLMSAQSALPSASSAVDSAARRPLGTTTMELWILTIVGAAIVAMVVGLS
jgi:hypothetical protein